MATSFDPGPYGDPRPYVKDYGRSPGIVLPYDAEPDYSGLTGVGHHNVSIRPWLSASSHPVGTGTVYYREPVAPAPKPDPITPKVALPSGVRSVTDADRTQAARLADPQIRAAVDRQTAIAKVYAEQHESEQHARKKIREQAAASVEERFGVPVEDLAEIVETWKHRLSVLPWWRRRARREARRSLATATANHQEAQGMTRYTL